MPQRGRSVAVTVSIALVAVTTIFVAARAVHLSYMARARLLSDLRVLAAADADRTAIALELPIWNIDRAQIDRVIEGTFRAPEILAVVVEAAGRRHAMARDASWRPLPFDGAVVEAGTLREDRDVVLGGDRIGSLSVYVTQRFADEELRKTLFTHLAGAVLVAVAMVGSLWMLLRRAVILPLRSLERYAHAVSLGTRPDAAPSGARFQGEMEGLRASMEHMVSLLDTRYAQLAAAESSIHALAGRLQAVREEEKARIARDLHDELGQLLTAVQMELRWVEERLAEHPEAALANALTDHVVETTRLVEQTAKAVQRIAADLRPSVLDRLGLGAALRQEARLFHERSGVRCDVVVADGLPALAPDAATSLYRVAQEALTNVARHAHASAVKVSLAWSPDDVSLRVEDDGRGLADVAPGPRALGLLGMRERAAMLGGDMTFARGASGGTVVEMRVPLARVVASDARRAVP